MLVEHQSGGELLFFFNVFILVLSLKTLQTISKILINRKCVDFEWANINIFDKNILRTIHEL